jgi:hypothetical protein
MISIALILGAPVTEPHGKIVSSRSTASARPQLGVTVEVI